MGFNDEDWILMANL